MLLCGAWALTLARAEDCPYAEYRYLAPARQLQITTGFMERAPETASRPAQLEKQGIIILESAAGHTFDKKEKIGPHQIETTIRVAPPVGHGEGGASSFVDLKIILDGETLVDCPLSNAYLSLDRISIDPARRFVTLTARYGILHFDGFESRKVVDEDWLTARAKEVESLIIKGPSGLH